MEKKMTTELQKLDDEIAGIPTSPKTDEDFDRRAELMAKRIQLDQAIRAAAANGRPQPRGNLVVNVPDGVGLTHLYGDRGRVVCSRMTEDGRIVFDLFLHEFRILLSDRTHGLAWQNANPEAVRRLGEAA
jgi:hypothetical protein